MNTMRRAKPYLVLAAAVLFTIVGAIYVSENSEGPGSLLLFVSTATLLSFVLFALARSEALARSAAEATLARLKQAEREREQLLSLEHTARKQAESANRVKDEFIATLSHELRTPLTPILGWTQLLRDRMRDEAVLRRGLGVIEQNARTQAQLIDDLLDLSRIVTGKMHVKTEPVELQPIVQAAVDALQSAADAKRIEIQIRTPRWTIHLNADPVRLQQILWNLLSNAVKFTPNGGKIEVCCERSHEEIRVCVADNGEGIAPEFLPHVFDRFTQADSTNIRTHGGLGAGLAIVRYLVEMHGGSVSAESPGKGAGAVFTVILPARAGAGKSRIRRSRRIGRNVSTLKTVRLLVVDDEKDVRELLAVVLAHEGATVATAASASEALQILQENPPDILISDIAMPEENGYVLLETWREFERRTGRPPVPAIALTAYARDEDRKRAMQAGFEIYLTKPVEAPELVSAIVELATKHLGKTG